MIWFYEQLIYAFVFLLLSIVVHEYAHYLTAINKGYKAKFFFTWKKGLGVDLINVTSNKDYIVILEKGMFSGFVVLIAGLVFFWFWSPMVFIVYYFGCRSDLRNIKWARDQLKRRF